MTRPKPPKPAILITVQGGVADWVTSGDVVVASVDWDDMRSDNHHEHMPEDIKEKIAEVSKLPDGIPWKADVLKRLSDYLQVVQHG